MIIRTLLSTWALALIGAATISTTTLASEASPATPAEAKGETLLVLGDSLSAAYGMDISAGWARLLHHKLKQYGKYQIVNASVSGETTGGGLARLPALLKAHKPKVVVVELGGNDGLRGHPVKIIRRNLATITQLSRQAGAKVLLLGMQIPPNYGQRYTAQFTEIFPALAKDQQVALVPFFLDKVAVNRDLMQADGIHPDATAQPQLLNNVLPYLLPLLHP